MSKKHAGLYAAALLIMTTIIGCKQSATPEVVQEQDAEPEATTIAAPTKQVDGGAAPSVKAAPYSGESNFAGPALNAIKQYGTPAAQTLSPAVATAATTSSKLEGCTYTANPSDSYLIDLDGDGKREGISFYSLTQCKVGQDLRVLVLFRQDSTGRWDTILETAVTVGMAPPRPILEIDPEAGTISIQTTPDNLGGPPPAPEVIEVPLANTALTQTGSK